MALSVFTTLLSRKSKWSSNDFAIDFPMKLDWSDLSIRIGMGWEPEWDLTLLDFNAMTGYDAVSGER